MNRDGVKVRKGRDSEQAPATTPLPPERAEPVAYMVDHVKSGKPLDGLVAIDINVDVLEIIEAAKKSVKLAR